jgi:5-methylcytosine-specific restriction endonuclease McrA
MNKGRKEHSTIRKRLIYERGHMCEMCGYTGNLQLHHKLPAQFGGDCSDSNLILLCEKCHAEAHGYNKKNYVDPHRQGWKGNK